MPLAYGLIESADIALPNLPPALDGVRVGHVCDLHVRRQRKLYYRLISQLASVRLDMIVLTGDYMTHPGDEPDAIDVMTRMIEGLRPSIGAFGVYGNHDTAELREALAELPVTWLEDAAVAVTDRPIDVLGFNCAFMVGPDAVTLAQSCHEQLAPRDAVANGGNDRLRIALAHHPQRITIAADFGADVLFAGHTHGGQIRLPGGRAIVNSTDLPAKLTSGLLRHQNTVLAVSRGLGTQALPLRLFCPPHVPVYTLRRAVLQGRYTDDIEMQRAW